MPVRDKTAEGQTGKPCVRCGRDTSNLPRVKDASGRYACKACVSAARIGGAAARGAVVPVPASPTARVDATRQAQVATAQSASASPAPDDSLDIIPLEDVEMTGSRAPCPRCGAGLLAGVSACRSCGYEPSSVPLNTEKAREVLGDFDNDGTFTPSEERSRMKAAAKAKKKSPKQAPAEIPCKKCSQNLLGVPVRKDGVTVCPECGVENRPITRREYDEEVSASIHRSTYLRPALMLGIGLAVCVVLWAANGWIRGGMNGAASGWIGNGPPGGLLGSVVQVGIGLVGFAIASMAAVGAVMFAGMVWTGFSGAMHLTVLQTTACLATSLALVLFLRAIPIPFPGMIIIALGAMVYAYLLSEEIDVYLQDATIITVMTFAAIVLISFTGLLL